MKKLWKKIKAFLRKIKTKFLNKKKAKEINERILVLIDKINELREKLHIDGGDDE